MKRGVPLAVACALIPGCSATPTLALQLATQPTTISFRPDGGEWATVTELSQSQRAALYDVPELDGTIAIACTRVDGTVQVEELFATAADLTTELYAPVVPWPQLDCTPQRSGPELVELEGEMVQGGQVYVDGTTLSGAGTWAFRSAVTLGVHDLVAVGQSAGLIRHDQPMVVPYVESSIDLRQGLDLGTLEINDGGGITSETELVTVNGTRVVLETASDEALYFPAELLQPGDVQVVLVDELEGIEPGNGLRDSSEALFDPNQPTVPFLPMLDPPVGATFGSDDVSADLSGITSHDEGVTAYRVTYTTQAGSLAATATRAWIASHQAEVVFDPTFPGFRWPIDGGAHHELAIMQRSPSVVLESRIADP